MAEFSAADVKRLRDATGAGMMDSKRALQEAGGDFDRPLEVLRIKGEARADKRGQERTAANGLVADKARADEPPWGGEAAASIAAVGFALAAFPVGVERAWITRTVAVERTLAALRFFWKSPQGKQRDATGYKGFYYHCLDMMSGRRHGDCELSTIDSTFLFAGMLAAAAYFHRDSKEEQEIRTLADAIYRRVDWRWAQDGAATVTHGWKPESGFLKYRWEGYDEALLLYVLGLGSPTYPLPEESYAAWTATYEWKEIEGHEFLFGSSLFTHQFSHLWIDFRGIPDAFMRGKGIVGPAGWNALGYSNGAELTGCGRS